MYGEDWITSHTVLESSSYGSAPLDFLKKFGIADSEWNTVSQVVVLRACVLHPWMASTPNYPEHWQSYLNIMKVTIARIVADEDLLSQTAQQHGTAVVHPPAQAGLATQ